MRTLRVALIPMIVCAGTLALGNPSPAAADERDVGDDDVTRVVERELLYDSAVPENEIVVTTRDGIVTLEGSVTNVLARERAARIAETVKGVRSVVNRLRIEPTRRSDAAVERDVEMALLQDPATDAYEVGVEVEDGHVTLLGTVQSLTEKNLCTTVAQGVQGVRGVTNEIALSFPDERPDYEIQKEIEEALRWNALVDDALIDVKVEEGEVELSGTVGSAAEKREARYTAWTGGVRSVDDSALNVSRWARDDDLRKRKYVDRSDDEIRTAVEDAFARDPRVLSFDVNPSVKGGIVTLRGAVNNLKAKRAAAQDAENTVGVLSVENYLKVRPLAKLSDREIELNIRQALLRDPYVERYEVVVDVHDGVAHLYGTVDSHFEKAQADDIASRAAGVVDVKNSLSVDFTKPYAWDPFVDDWNIYRYDWYDYAPTYTYLSDQEIRNNIENELWWSPFVDSDEIDVKVEDGVATLTGSVDSWMERGAARDNAIDGGATFVRNKLSVQ